MVFVLVEMWVFLLLWNAGYRHFMADKVLGLALSDRDANLKYGAIQAFVYAFTYRRNLCRQGLGFKNHSFGASVMILGNLIIAFSPLHFSIWELHLQLLEQVSSSQIFLQWLGAL
jgi:POT family proton-dependent oligopeptide transporter